MAVVTFIVTLSLLLSTPDATKGMSLTMPGEFLLKDLVLLAVGLWTFATSRAAIASGSSPSGLVRTV